MLRIRVTAAFASAFVTAAMLAFGLAWIAGDVTGAAGLSPAVRRGIAVPVFAALALVDGWSIRRKRYCPLGWRRQTPRLLMHWRSPSRVAAVWGFDTGLAVTTFRVASLTWGAFVLTFLGLAPWWTGVMYGIGFALPSTVLLWRHRAGRVAHEAAPTDPGLVAMLAQRPRVQLASILALVLAGAGLLARSGG